MSLAAILPERRSPLLLTITTTQAVRQTRIRALCLGFRHAVRPRRMNLAVRQNHAVTTAPSFRCHWHGHMGRWGLMTLEKGAYILVALRL